MTDTQFNLTFGGRMYTIKANFWLFWEKLINELGVIMRNLSGNRNKMMAKLMLTFILLLNFFSLEFASAFEEWKGWRSGKYVREGVAYRQGDKVITVNLLGKEYEFKKSGKKLYKAYDYETGNFLEMKIKKDGEGEIYDYETGEDYQVMLPEFFK